jgi:hypothetical protein
MSHHREKAMLRRLRRRANRGAARDRRRWSAETRSGAVRNSGFGAQVKAPRKRGFRAGPVLGVASLESGAQVAPNSGENVFGRPLQRLPPGASGNHQVFP